MNPGESRAEPSTDIPLAVEIQFEAARRLGMKARVLDPEYGYLFEIEKDGRKRVLLGGRSPLNDAVAARLAEDKFYTGMILADADYRVPESVRCLSQHHFKLERYRDRAGLEPGLSFASQHGYPLVVKPNRMSHGREVSVVDNEEELRRAVSIAWQLDSIALVQRFIEGKDYRLNFIDGEYLVGYERTPIVLQGDGKRSVRELLCAVDPRASDEQSFRKMTREPAWQESIRSRGWDESSILDPGSNVALGSRILNLHAFSTAHLIERIPNSWLDYCTGIGRAMSLRHFGVDLKATSPESDPRAARLEGAPRSATIIEVNASPLLSQIYRLGHREKAIDCQMRILDKLFMSFR